MPQFDVNKPFWLDQFHARKLIQDAWLGQTYSGSLLSELICAGTQGVHSHSMMFSRDEFDDIDVLELREFVGGRRRTLTFHTDQPYRIDVFSPRTDIWPDFSPQMAVATMRLLADCRYGWSGIWQFVARSIPFLRRFYAASTDDQLVDPEANKRQPFCSHAVSLAYQTGGVDPVPRCPNYMVSPANLTHSLFFNYEFTLVNVWCMDRYGESILGEANMNAMKLFPLRLDDA